MTVGFRTPGEAVAAYPHPQVRIVNGVTEYLYPAALNSVRGVSGPFASPDRRTVVRPFVPRH